MTETPIADQIETGADFEDRRRGQFLRTYPTTWRPAVGVETVGTFMRLDQGPENEYGTPWIVVFTGEYGEDHKGNEMEPGKEYGFWLIHSIALDQFRKARPAAGERFALLYEGERASKTRRDKHGNPVEYHAYRVICPDRAPATGPAGWDALGEPDTEDPGF